MFNSKVIRIVIKAYDLQGIFIQSLKITNSEKEKLLY